MHWFYLAIVLGVFLPVPLLLYGTRRLRMGLGDILGLILFMTVEVLWYGLVQSGEFVIYDTSKTLSFRFLNLFAGDYILIALVYLNTVGIYRWMSRR